MVVEPRQRLTSDVRRQLILDSARAVFARHGFHGAGTSEIARRAGCSEPMLYKHFASKQALFAAVLDDATTQLKARIHAMLEQCDSELEGIAAMVGMLAHDDLMIEVSRLRMLAITLTDDPEIRSALEQQRVRDAKAGGGGGRQLQERGLARNDMDADQIGWLWLGFVLAVGSVSLEGPGSGRAARDSPDPPHAAARTEARGGHR